MSYNLSICEEYNSGKCVYIGKSIAIFERCQFEDFSGELKIKCIQTCIQKKTIEKIKKLEERI